MSSLLPFVCKRGIHTTSAVTAAATSHRFVVCGGGTGGLAVASSLARRFGEKQVAVVEPSDVNLFMLVYTYYIIYY